MRWIRVTSSSSRAEADIWQPRVRREGHSDLSKYVWPKILMSKSQGGVLVTSSYIITSELKMKRRNTLVTWRYVRTVMIRGWIWFEAAVAILLWWCWNIIISYWIWHAEQWGKLSMQNEMYNVQWQQEPKRDKSPTTTAPPCLRSEAQSWQLLGSMCRPPTVHDGCVISGPSAGHAGDKVAHSETGEPHTAPEYLLSTNPTQ